MIRRDVAHAAHVGRQRVHVIHGVRGVPRIRRLAEIADDELVGATRRVLRTFQIDAAHPMTLLREMRHEVVADESARAGHEDSHCVHSILSWRSGSVSVNLGHESGAREATNTARWLPCLYGTSQSVSKSGWSG